MKQRIAFALIIIAFAMSGALHYREYRKSQEFSDTFRIQAEIEFKRTSLMIVYQEVLQSVVKELDAMKHGRIEAESQELSRLLDLFRMKSNFRRRSHETDADLYCRNQRRRGKILCLRDAGGGG